MMNWIFFSYQGNKYEGIKIRHVWLQSSFFSIYAYLQAAFGAVFSQDNKSRMVNTRTNKRIDITVS